VGVPVVMTDSREPDLALKPHDTRLRARAFRVARSRALSPAEWFSGAPLAR